jgi:hypothetical protein
MVDHRGKTYDELLGVINLLEILLFEERKLVQELRQRLNDCQDGLSARPSAIGSWREDLGEKRNG